MSKLIEIIVLEGTALLLFAFAYAIGVKGKMSLIAGYSAKTADQVRDKPALARLIARLLVLVGIASASMPLATAVWGRQSGALAMWVGGYAGFIVGTTALALWEAREFTA